MDNINIAIDGPSGAGKSSISRTLAKRLGYIYIDTGAMYRAVGLYVQKLGKSTKSAGDVVSLLPEINISIECSDKFEVQQVYLNDENVTEQIRTSEISVAASEVSAVPEVREKLLSLQRDTAARSNVVMDGRDIGAEILPNAQVKIFLTADVEARARRRFDELIKSGANATFDDVLADMKARDRQDSTREISPLRKAADAITVDTTEINFAQSVDRIYEIITGKLTENSKQPRKKMKHKAAIGRPTLFFRFAKRLLYIMFKLLYRYKVSGEENVPQGESFIACSNHNSPFDPIIVGLIMPDNFAAMAKKELFDIPVLGFLIRNLGAFPVKRGRQDVAAIRTALQILEAGKAFVMFPEGARIKYGEVVKGKNGAALIATRAQVKILPVGIKGGYVPFRKVYVNVGAPLDLSEYYDKPLKSEDYTEITERLMSEIDRLKKM